MLGKKLDNNAVSQKLTTSKFVRHFNISIIFGEAFRTDCVYSLPRYFTVRPERGPVGKLWLLI